MDSIQFDIQQKPCQLSFQKGDRVILNLSVSDQIPISVRREMLTKLLFLIRF